MIEPTAHDSQTSPPHAIVDIDHRDETDRNSVYVDELSRLPEVDQRTVFRELAGRLLDPSGDAELTVCDNDGNVLGYFIPVARRLRETAPKPVEIPDIETFLADSEPAETVFDRVETADD